VPAKDDFLTPDLRLRLGEFPAALRAAAYAARMHRDQTRATGEPYIVHPVAVVESLLDEAGETEEVVLCAAFLHDVLEDCPEAREEDLEVLFGPHVTDLVCALTKPPREAYPSPEERMEAYMEGILQRGSRAVKVKLADRLHNTRTRAGLSPEKAERKLRETETYLLTVPEPYLDEGARALRDLLAREVEAGKEELGL